jgi:hypothetical protein
MRVCHLRGVRRRVDSCNASNPSLAELVDAELVDAELVDAELVDTELVDA